MKLLPLTLWSLLLSLPALSEQTVPAVTLAAVTDRADALYRVGETVTFQVTATTHDKPVSEIMLTCVLSKDGIEAQPPQLVKLVDGKATVTGTLNEPGFLQLRVQAGKASALTAAGFDPLALPPSLPVPDDFDAFWAEQKAALAAVPPKPKLTTVPTRAAEVELFDVQVDCAGGAPVSGYLARPLEAKAKSLPAILTVHGAGVRGANAGVTSWAIKEGGMLAMDINAHGLPNGQPEAFYKALAEGDLRDYRTRGSENRDDVYFKGMFLRVLRAIDFLTAQPEWDGRTLIVYGSSQGGFQAFAAAGLDERVTFLCAGVPAGCDHSGMMANRVAGWPKLVALDEQRAPVEKSLQTARYFDNVNFATKARCKGAVVTVGFIDATCPPTSVYAAYNALSIPKKMHHDPLAGHTNTPAASAFMQEAALEHVRLMRQPGS